MTAFGVFEVVDKQEAAGKRVFSFTWAEKLNNNEARCRLCVRGF